MTPEDLNQIRAIMREEIASNNQTLTAALREEFNERLTAAVAAIREEFNERLTAAVVAIRQEFAERLGAAVVALSADFSELRQEMIRRVEALNHRMDALERRMDRVAETSADVASNLSALTRWANRLDRDNLELRATQVAQQQAIDDLVKRTQRPPGRPSA